MTTYEYAVHWYASKNDTVNGFSVPEASAQEAIENFSVKFMPHLDKVVYREVGSTEWKIYEGEL